MVSRDNGSSKGEGWEGGEDPAWKSLVLAKGYQSHASTSQLTRDIESVVEEPNIFNVEDIGLLHGLKSTTQVENNHGYVDSFHPYC
mmetsp:Transcript_12752/g.25877  ORF Transcript_12752/g.25877 Transcript_12752/m.25877 type:complete len:86 (+) Transcript_12752:153-410(+)